MRNFTWFYPENLADAATIVGQDYVQLHGGGTGLLLRNLTGIRGLIELSRLPLNKVWQESDEIIIGSMCSYADVISEMRKVNPGHILVKCLAHSANTPLRNRITVGGSVAMFPPWSDLMGALIAMEATVSLIGSVEGDFPVLQYINDKRLSRNTLITAVKFKLADWLSAHYREVRTRSDMPVFNHTVLLKIVAGKITTSRIITVGTKSRFTHLTEVEEYLIGKRITNIDLKEVEKRVKLEFVAGRSDDPDYMSVKAGIELGRLIQQLVGI